MNARGRDRERGAGLIVIIVVTAFLAAVGMSLLMLTNMGPKMSGGLRTQDQAFNAAEAGFEAARAIIENQFGGGLWSTFAGHYVTQPAYIDIPFTAGVPNANYFRRRTDQELIYVFDPNNDGLPDIANLLFFQRTFARTESGAVDMSLTSTAFLINDEAGGGIQDPNDALLVLIGVVRSGTRILATARIEVVLAYQTGT